jgi:hypothetical protein
MTIWNCAAPASPTLAKGARQRVDVGDLDVLGRGAGGPDGRNPNATAMAAPSTLENYAIAYFLLGLFWLVTL